jgi:hypothetical protein
MEREKSLALTALKLHFLSHPAHSLVTIWMMVFWLLQCDMQINIIIIIMFMKV